MTFSANGNKRKRVVVTGLGAITPLGLSPEEFWRNCLAGKSGAANVTLFDTSKLKTKFAAEVKGFEPARYVESKEVRRLGRSTLFSLAAARQALDDAGLKSFPEPFRAGVVIGTAFAGLVETAEGHRMFMETGKLSPFLPASILINMPAFHIAMYYGAKGYNSTISTACAASTQAIGDAAQVIRNGYADVIITGGTEAILSDYVFVGFGTMRALSTRNDDPEHASRPFDKTRDGFVVGEGATIFVIESLEHAQARGAKIYGEILGHAANNDGYHFAAPDPEANGATQVMKQALENSNLTIHDVDYINAHGTSTPLNDAGETLAIKQVFGERAYQIPISSTKSMIGHSLGASGSFEALACILTLRDQKIHPTINYETPDPACDLDYVPNVARDARVGVILSNSFGLGGQNATLVLGRYNHTDK